MASLPIVAQSLYSETGIASYYGADFRGRRTASGEKFNPDSLTCAHRTQPFGTLLKVTMLSTGDTVIVRVNDRGPFVRGRVVDISTRAAEIIGLKAMGLAKVRVDYVPPPAPLTADAASAINRNAVLSRVEALRPMLHPPANVAGPLLPAVKRKPDSSGWDFGAPVRN